ncbi:MAG: dihydropyrimidinase [Acidimicrobiia bacterium]|nr:MAG: dihydropyrimidinase [Acidimicrobiia bacterium]
MSTLIKGGTVITAIDTTDADVRIDGELVTGIAAPGTHDWEAAADTVIDATGKYVVPGSLDVHTHMELPFGGTVASDNFESGSRAAAWGGTTTMVDFAVQVKGESMMEGFENWMAKASGNCAVDYGFHMIAGDINQDTLAEMDKLMESGVTSFKLFMAYPGVLYSDDGEILRAMQKAADIGALIMMHAENGIAIDVLREQAIERGETDPVNHGLTRPSITEGEATHRAIALAELTGVPLYIVHLSAKEALDEVTMARDRGLPVYAETCPQYLFLSLEEHLAAPGFEGAKYVCSTPVRQRGEGHQDALWRGLITDDLQVVSTDHCPFCMDDHPTLGTQKRLGEGDFTKIPNGLPGVEDRFQLMYQGGVAEGRFSVNRWIEVCCTAPAKLFGLYPKKGTIAVGSDADIVIFDPDVRWTKSVDEHHMDVDYSCYEGMEVQGKVETVLLRGEVIIDGDEYLGMKGDGRYLPRAAAGSRP